MKVKILLGGISYVLAGLLTSCNNEDNILSKQELTESNKEIFKQTIKFEGQTFHVSCKFENDSLIYLDEKFNTLYKNTISKIPELSIFYSLDEKGNDVVEFFSSEKELIKNKNMQFFNEQSIENNNANSRVNNLEPKAGRAIMYDDTGFKDRTVILDIDYDYYPMIPNLKAYAGFNDKTSAIRVFNFLEPNKYYRPSYSHPSASVKGSELRTCLIGYEDSNYKGKILYCVASYSPNQDINKPETASHQDYKLKNIGWNDKISSCVFRIITVNNIENGHINPHRPI